MILPTKHIRPERALLTIGAEILASLRGPMTVSRVWDEMRRRRGETAEPAPQPAPDDTGKDKGADDDGNDNSGPGNNNGNGNGNGRGDDD